MLPQRLRRVSGYVGLFLPKVLQTPHQHDPGLALLELENVQRCAFLREGVPEDGWVFVRCPCRAPVPSKMTCLPSCLGQPLKGVPSARCPEV